MKLLRNSGEFSKVESPSGCNLLYQGYFLVTVSFFLFNLKRLRQMENSKEIVLNFLTKIKHKQNNFFKKFYKKNTKPVTV
jgi:hypothetical protein